ncbi:hypothetical protein D3A96_03655 [Robertkochia marina]|nr:hypothetical protein D3A96_03655 [Robertkochia marina]
MGDYRTIGSGNWTDLSVWEYYNGTNWVPATSYPGQNTGTNDVTISPGDDITLNVSISNQFNSLLIASNASEGGNLIIPSNASVQFYALQVNIQPDFGLMTWLGNADLFLLSNSSISAYPGAFDTGNSGNGNGNCTSSQVIWLGSNKFSTCNGNGSADNSFDEIENAPAAPSADEFQVDCGTSITATATAPSGSTVKWYDAQTGGNVVNDPTLSSPGTQVYWAASINGSNVESVFRTRVELTLLPEASIVTNPVNYTGFAGDDATFSVIANNASEYFWEVSTNGGVNFSPIDSVENPSAITSTLSIPNIDIDLNDYRYRVVVRNEGDNCADVESVPVILEVRVRTVITNRNKTYRVNKT